MRQRQDNGAFTLIELAMASFVAGVALIAIVALLGAGNRAAMEGEAAIRASLFARDAFATIRLLNDRAADDPADPDAWGKFWEECRDGGAITQTTSFASGVWKADSTGELPSLYLDGNMHTNYWCPANVRDGGEDGELVSADFALRYRFDVRSSSESSDGGANTRNDQSVPHTYYTVDLHVWNGISLSHDSEFSYFAVFSNPGSMHPAPHVSGNDSTVP